MTQKRKFYSDPLAAMWMAKHFGMAIGDSTTSEETIYHWAYNEGCERFYIHKNSLGLLEPQPGDLVRVRGLNGIRVDLWKEGWTVPCEEIIQRNGIAFMWPESEEA